MKKQLILGNHAILLQRYPLNSNPTLQAWNAADEYLINQVAQLPKQQKSRVLIINDSFGALTCAINIENTVYCTDSLLSQIAFEENCKINQISINNLIQIDCLESFPPKISLVIFKIPKSVAMLEYQLTKITNEVAVGTKIIAATMSKDLHSSTLKIFQKIVGNTTTSLAKKKARLVFFEVPEKKPKLPQPFPKTWQLAVHENELSITNHANVFSNKGLDLGARFLLENYPAGEFKNIIDLGCGNGVLGLAAHLVYDNANITFTDESHMAIASAKLNWENNFPNASDLAEFKITDCLKGLPNSFADLILCNPPFHQQQTITDDIALQMFSESASILNKNGVLMVVGNRHLGYHIKLKKCFKNVKQVASNPKFVIFLASKM